MKRGVIFLIIISLFIVPIISAQPPPQQNVNIVVGYDVDIPKLSHIEQSTPFELNFHVFNRSDGLRIDNSSVNCTFHLNNQTGQHVITEIDMPFDLDSNDWEFTILGGNFTTLGTYFVLVNCESLGFGGFNSFAVDVTATGQEYTTSQSILYLTLLSGSILIFLLTLWGGLVLPFKNKRNEAGEMIGIGRVKYLKLLLLYTSYMLFTWIVNLLHVASNNFGTLSQFTNFFRITFLILLSTAYPIFVIMFITTLVLAWNDLKLRNLILKGFRPR